VTNARAPLRCQRLRRVLQALALAGLTGILFIVVLESSLRIWPKLIPSGQLEYFSPGLRGRIAARVGLPTEGQIVPVERSDGGVPHELWRLAPFSRAFGSQAMDEEGFCNPRGSYAARKTFDIVLIGDSFTFCWFVPYDSTWAAGLARRTGRGVYDLGMPDMGPYEYLELLRHFGLVKKPKVVVMAYYGGNDVRDAEKYADYGSARRTMPTPVSGWYTTGHRPSARAVFYRLRDAPVMRRSYAANFVLTVIGLAYVNATQASVAKQNNFRYSLVFGDRWIEMNPGNGDNDELGSARSVRDGALSLHILDSALDHFGKLGAEYHFCPCLVYLPSAHVVYWDYAAFEDTTARRPLWEFHEQQRSYLLQQAAHFGYRFIDLTNPLVAAARRGGPDHLLFTPKDLHPSVDGHRAIAAAVEAAIRRVCGGEVP
jgi:hypothetical protein